MPSAAVSPLQTTLHVVISSGHGQCGGGWIMGSKHTACLVLLLLLLLPIARPAAGGEHVGGRRRGGKVSQRRCGCGACTVGIPTASYPPVPKIDCSLCPAGKYMVQACTALADRVCASCSTMPDSCPANQYRSRCGSASQVRVDALYGLNFLVNIAGVDNLRIVSCPESCC